MRTPAWLRECNLTDADLARLERGDTPSHCQKYNPLNEKVKRVIGAGIAQLARDTLRASLALIVVIEVLRFIDMRVMRL